MSTELGWFCPRYGVIWVPKFVSRKNLFLSPRLLFVRISRLVIYTSITIGFSDSFGTKFFFIISLPLSFRVSSYGVFVLVWKLLVFYYSYILLLLILGVVFLQLLFFHFFVFLYHLSFLLLFIEFLDYRMSTYIECLLL